jgi:hypothetical protein
MHCEASASMTFRSSVSKSVLNSAARWKHGWNSNRRRSCARYDTIRYMSDIALSREPHTNIQPSPAQQPCVGPQLRLPKCGHVNPGTVIITIAIALTELRASRAWRC